MKKSKKTGLHVVRRINHQEDLETRVSAILADMLHNCDAHQDLCNQASAEPDAVDKALNSGRVRGALDKAKVAFLIAQAPALLARLVAVALDGNQWAWTILVNSLGAAEILRASLPEAAAQELPPIVSPEFEESLVKNLRELVQEMPHGQTLSEGERPSSE